MDLSMDGTFSSAKIPLPVRDFDSLDVKGAILFLIPTIA